MPLYSTFLSIKLMLDYTLKMCDIRLRGHAYTCVVLVFGILFGLGDVKGFVHFFALPNRRRAKLRKCGSLENGKSVQLAKKHEIHVKFKSLFNLLYNFQTLVW